MKFLKRKFEIDRCTGIEEMRSSNLFMFHSCLFTFNGCLFILLTYYMKSFALKRILKVLSFYAEVHTADLYEIFQAKEAI